MAMDSGSARRDIITAAITAELDRQARGGVARVDIDALASAIEAALDPPPPANEGRHPDELNATNDD
jgi:hypothetical protein